MADETENTDTDSVSSSGSCAQAEHTPGPWRIEGSSIVRDDPLRPDEYWVIAMLGDSAPSKPNAEGHKPSDLGIGVGTILANAELIAAAPKLLSAAKQAEEALHHMMCANSMEPHEYESYTDLVDAIAKAEGEV